MSSSEVLINKLAREELVDMVPYQSARRLFASGDADLANSKTWLNANEAPGQGKYQLNSENINRYPDFQPKSLLVHIVVTVIYLLKTYWQHVALMKA